jgi:hypothetical protein
MVTVEFHGAKEMVAALKRMRSQAVPYAVRNALNTQAFEARKAWVGFIQRDFVNRNTFTQRSIQVVKAGGLSVANMQSVVGSTAPYMGTQEEGGTVRGKGAHKAIPAPTAAGLPAGSRRTKLVRARFYLGAINAQHPALVGSRKQRNAIAIAVARRAGLKFALLERPSGGKGLFLLGGSKRQPTTRLLWDVSRGSVQVPGAHQLERTLAHVLTQSERVHMDALVQQLTRNGIPFTL